MRYFWVLMMLVTSPAWAASPEQTLVADKLWLHCKACHAVGTLRFLRSADADVIWQNIKTETVPGTTKVWKLAIKDVLSWPSGDPPAAGTMRLPGKEWMPKGVKRLDLATDKVGAESARSYILRVLSEAE